MLPMLSTQQIAEDEHKPSVLAHLPLMNFFVPDEGHVVTAVFSDEHQPRERGEASNGEIAWVEDHFLSFALLINSNKVLTFSSITATRKSSLAKTMISVIKASRMGHPFVSISNVSMS
jgi:hypothetical protein